VTLDATVSSPAGTSKGTVTFTEGSKHLGTFTLAGGKARLVTPALVAGNHSLRASYIPGANSKHGANFMPSTSPAHFQTVTKARLLVTPMAATVHYKDVLPAFQWTAHFVKGDTATSLATQPTCASTANTDSARKVSSPAGVYTITCKGAVDRNYSIVYATGKLTVLPANVVVIYAGPRSVRHGGSVKLKVKLTSAAGWPVLDTHDRCRRRQTAVHHGANDETRQCFMHSGEGESRGWHNYGRGHVPR
jgi:Bacterial Ig-like domain (group 3)/MBG domain (YGX type)